MVRKEITWLGHAAFKAEIGENVIFFDPWISGNPMCPIKDVKEIEKATLVLVSHDHSDHGFDDAVKICKNTGATFVGVFELAQEAKKRGVEKIVGGNISGEVKVDDITIFFTPALHSSSIGVPCGFVVRTPELTIYHAGDTGFFSEMEDISKLYEIDVAILPIGSTYTMGPKEAALAVEKLKPKIVIPCHYNTFPQIKQDPQEFKRLVGEKCRVEILEPGKSLIIP